MDPDSASASSGSGDGCFQLDKPEKRSRPSASAADLDGKLPARSMLLARLYDQAKRSTRHELVESAVQAAPEMPRSASARLIGFFAGDTSARRKRAVARSRSGNLAFFDFGVTTGVRRRRRRRRLVVGSGGVVVGRWWLLVGGRGELVGWLAFGWAFGG
jgi:hypothetical protein